MRTKPIKPSRPIFEILGLEPQIKIALDAAGREVSESAGEVAAVILRGSGTTKEDMVAAYHYAKQRSR